MPYKTFALFFSFILLFSACQWQQNSLSPTLSELSTDTNYIPPPNLSLPKVAKIDTPFTRYKILSNLQKKIDTQQPLVIHVFVPLCDNEHQGIVPVSKTLGNGQNPNSNLYWGALYGVKTHFKKSKKWTLLQAQKNVSEVILERVVFERKMRKNTIYLVADAYDGRAMKTCLQDYFAAIVGTANTSFIELATGKKIAIASASDLLVFNGHNGLMDVQVESPANRDGRLKDAVIIACISGDYFATQLLKAGGYPVVTTTNLLAPEAYVLEAIFEEWLLLKDAESIRKSAGKAYHQYQKCGLKGANRLFSSGWGNY